MLSRLSLAAAAVALFAASHLPVFVESSGAAGIRYRTESSATSQKYLPESMVGGVAALDYDGDGWMDLFFVNGAALADPMPPGKRPDKSDPRYWNRLYRNEGGGKFTDVTAATGLQGRDYGMGAAVGDFDNDGRPDLYVTGLGRNTLYHNNGDGTFAEVTDRAGVAGGEWSAGAAFFDYDRDGRLDLVVTRYLDWRFEANPYCGEKLPGRRAYCHPDQFRPITHLLYHNNGDGTFTDVSRRSNIAAHPGKGLGVAINDFDRDGWPDIVIANDSFPQQLFRNRHDGTFEEVALTAGAAYDDDGRAFAGMGVDAADYDRDGWPDLFINALGNQRYALFRNLKGSFDYRSASSGIGAISQLHSGWGAKFVDYDNDGWLDLFVAQSHVMDNIELTQPSLRYREPLLLMRNLRGRFEDVSATSGESFRSSQAARGAAAVDWDNDGFVDFAINVKDAPALLLHNQGGNGNHWLAIRAVGTRSNRDGFGATVRLMAGDGSEQYGYVSAAGSYLSSNDPRLHFGLGAARTVKRLEITWPSGTRQTLENITADQILTIREQ